MLELLCHKRNFLLTTVIDDTIFLKIFKTVTWEKNVIRRYYFCSGSIMMKLQLPLKHGFYTDEKLLELFCIKNDFAKNFAKCHHLLKYFVSHITVILPNDTFLYYGKNQISLWYIILENVFLLPE